MIAANVTTVTQRKVDLLARGIVDRLANAGRGHCARVDFLTTQEAQLVCERLRATSPIPHLTARVLAPRQEGAQSIFIGADEAIELRNRKETILCLFIAVDLVDAAFSSLANAFEVIDGRALYHKALERLLSDLDPHVAEKVRAAFARVRVSPRATDTQRLDFAVAASERAEIGELERAGLELYRIGLIADGGADFVTRLEQNRRSVLSLSRPAKLQAGPGERIGDVGVDQSTSARLLEFFRTRAMSDVASWSRALSARPDLTFERWVFPREEQSDLRSVRVKPFTNDTGAVERYCKLKQPGGSPEGALEAEYGPKGTLVVKWETEPKEPRNLSRWRVEIVPSGGSADDVPDELPGREVPGKRSEVTLKLDIEPEEPIDYAVCVRVTPLDSGKHEIVDQETGESLAAESQEFYLVPAGETGTDGGTRETRKTVANIAFGRMQYLLSSREVAIAEDQAQWTHKDLDYFSLRLNGRRELHVGASPVLLALERTILKNPRGATSFVVRSGELAPLEAEAVEAVERPQVESEAWQSFLNARATFFGRLTGKAPRDVLEAADWSPDLADSAIRYAQMYARLLEELVRSGATRDELLAALGVDSLLVTLEEGAGTEEALIILPTHPVRAAWLASYTRLLRAWEDRVVAWGASSRSRACDLDLLKLISPVNVPGFGLHPASAQAFVFMQNLLFFNGVALPAEVSDPQRRLGDLAMMLGIEASRTTDDDISPDRLGGHLGRFLQTHPYIEGLRVALLNPDRGELLAEAVARLFERMTAEGDEQAEAEKAALPGLEVTAYIERPERGAAQALERVRPILTEQRLASKPDALHPGLSVTVRDLAALPRTPLVDAHLVVVSDLTRPRVGMVLPPVGQDAGPQAPSFALYGLVTRLVPLLSTDTSGIVWRYIITPGMGGRGEQHPGGPPRYTDALIEAHAAQLKACAMAFGGDAEQVPALEVRLGREEQRLLAHVHEQANWVVSLDRHFALEYYDSPRTPQLAEVAQTYVLDYAPDFTEGLGHRMLVTTTWREEIVNLLRDAMEELGLRTIDSSVRQVLQTLKTVSGHLALQILASPSMATAAAGLAIVTAWLKAQRRLEQAVLVPVDLHPTLFTLSGTTTSRGERRCDLVLIGLRRNIVEATCIEVKWRRGNAPLDDLMPDMLAQMQGTAHALERRCFDPERIDGALQRAHLASVLRFYFERARRYGLFDASVESTFVEHLARLEKSGLDFRPAYEGFIVNLDGEPRKPLLVQDGKITFLTGQDVETVAEIRGGGDPESEAGDSTGQAPAMNELVGADHDSEMRRDTEDEGPRALDGTQAAQGATEDRVEREIQSPQVSSKVSEGDRTARGQMEPKEPRAEVRVALGEAQGEVVEWAPSVKGSPHLFITGIPGQGKSWTILRLLHELGRQGVPALVLDFHGQFADGASAYVQSAQPAILDAAAGLPFSPFEVSPDGGAASWKAATYELAEIFGYVAGLGDIQQDAIRLAIREAYVRHGYDQPDEGAERSLPTLADVLRNLKRLEAERRTANVLARCRPLLEMDLFRPEAGAQDLTSLARQGLVIDLHGLYAESLQLAAGAFVLRKIYRDMFHWGQTEHLRLAIVLDEAHRLARDVTLPKLMKEGRKFGISVIVASQGMGDFHADVLATAGTKIIFRTNYPDSRRIAGFIRSGSGADLAGRIEQLAVGTAYVQTPEMPYGALVHMYPPQAGAGG